MKKVGDLFEFAQPLTRDISSLRASSPIWASEASLARERFAARSRVLARLVSLAQKGEPARRLGHFREREPLLA